jgi:hypothetical protein
MGAKTGVATETLLVYGRCSLLKLSVAIYEREMAIKTSRFSLVA